MAEYAAMQGFNMGKYVPPDLEGTTSGNKLHNKNALGARASKLKQGILTVRFEMPYAIWCSTCPKPTIIGQGVRFNAEKRKVGNYYTTPIWSFKMRHAACGGEIELQTDPKNTAYVVISGAKKRDTGEDIVRVAEATVRELNQCHVPVLEHGRANHTCVTGISAQLLQFWIEERCFMII